MSSSESAVSAFFSAGKLLTPDALKYLEGKSWDRFLSGEYEFIVDLEDLLAREDRISILTCITERKTEVSTADIVRFYNSKYERMKAIMLSRLQKNFITLQAAAAPGSAGTVFVLGIVRECIPQDGGGYRLELEDPTGSASVFMPAGTAVDVVCDDVVAIEAVAGGKQLEGVKVLHPDVPLRAPTLGRGSACFISALHLNEAPRQELEGFLRWFEGQQIPYLFVAGAIGDTATFEAMVMEYCRSKTVFVSAPDDGSGMPNVPGTYRCRQIIPLSNPAFVSVNGVKILMMYDFQLSALKKRHLGAIKPVLTEDVMALHELPDIVHCGHSIEASVSNYRAVTIVHPGSLLTEFRPVMIDFTTREHQLLQPIDFLRAPTP